VASVVFSSVGPAGGGHFFPVVPSGGRLVALGAYFGRLAKAREYSRQAIGVAGL
jgi:hypothetical protein